MKNFQGKTFARSTLLRAGASAAALAAFTAALATPAFAQDAAKSTAAAGSDDTGQTVVVVGVRRSLKNAQAIKKDADTVVDSITATDIGAFPDKSVAEALQRVAGITVTRFAASDDTLHFSAEPSGVLVRGLQQVRNEFNGRDSFSANSGRGLGWGDVSPELMGGVDSYKNQTADMVEGGIAGTIDLRTRLPFDSKGQQIALSLTGNYGDLAKKWTPDVSGIYSNRWATTMGEFGLMVDIAHSYVETDSQGVAETRVGAYAPGVFGTGITYVPSSIGVEDTLYDRYRDGMSIAGQWRDNDHKFLLTAQYNRSTYHNTWHAHNLNSYISDLFYGKSVYTQMTSSGNIATPAPGTSFSFDKNGVFTGGTVENPQSGGWWGADDTASEGYGAISTGQPITTPCYNWQSTCANPDRGPDLGAITRYNDNHDMTQDLSLNLKWDPTDRLHMNFDVQYIDSTVHNYDMEVGMYTYADVKIDAPSGEMPTMQVLPGANNNYAPGGFTNADNYYFHHAMDHTEDDNGHEAAARFDVQYNFGGTWLDTLKAGVRYADREQTVRWSSYNWANIANDWTGTQQAYFNTDKPVYPSNGTVPWSFASGFPGLVGPNQYEFFNYNIESNRQAMAAALGAPTIGVGSWDPICSNTGSRAGETVTTKYGCFKPGEIDQVGEKTDAIYLELKFGGDQARMFGLPVSGNIGVRYVETRDDSIGGLNIPAALTTLETQCTVAAPPPPGAPAQPLSGSIGCYLNPQDIAFNNGATYITDAKSTHHNVLPSFNIRWKLSDTWQLRFAASEAMSRPDMGLLKNSTQIGVQLPGVNDVTAQGWTKVAGGYNNEGYQATGVYTANAYNPYLKPMTADQFDLSLEDYFASVGSFTFDAFYKKFQDYITYGRYNLNVVNNGVTREVAVSGPVNGDGASVKGFEVAYQRFFDFLPAPFNGLGIQTNYTHVINTGISNTNLHVVNNPNATLDGGVPDEIQVNALEGLSKDSYNVIAMYEKGKWGARLAYNYRSKFLVTRLDCCTYLPMWQNGQGQLDGSLRYALTDHIEVNVEGTNLLNATTILSQQVTDSDKGGMLIPSSWFKNDRRFQVGVRLKY